MSAVSSYLKRFMANNREVIPWIKMPRWQYRLNKGAHTALITITLIALGVGNWHALAWAIGCLLADSEDVLPRSAGSSGGRRHRSASARLRSVFNVPYQPDPADWVVDLICCAIIAPVLVSPGLRLRARRDRRLGVWLFGYGILYSGCVAVTVTAKAKRSAFPIACHWRPRRERPLQRQNQD
jgi:hypothetical protein